MRFAFFAGGPGWEQLYFIAVGSEWRFAIWTTSPSGVAGIRFPEGKRGKWREGAGARIGNRDARAAERINVVGQRLQSVLFSGALCLLLCGPICLFAAERAGVSLPSWFTAEDATYLSGGVEKTDLFDRQGLREILGGGFREAAETEVGNYIPCKATALLANAVLQRNAIALSNALYQWPCYPTSFGAEYLYIPEQGAVTAWPRSTDPLEDGGLLNLGDQLRAFAADNKGVSVCAYVVDMSATARTNPACPLVSESYTTSQVVDALKGCVGDAVTVLGAGSDSLDDYYGRFFRSDHHWRASEAVRTYNEIAAWAGKDELPTATVPVDGPNYSGAYARNSLCIVEDAPSRLAYDFDSVRLEKGGVTENGNEHKLYENATEQNKHWRFYDLFYDSFTHSEGMGGGSVLLVCDSFGYALLRPLSIGYEKVSCSNALHASSKTDASLAKLIEDCGADTVVFVGHAGNYSSFVKRNPAFLL